MGESEYEQETKLKKIFLELKDGFKKLDSIPDAAKQQSLLKDLTAKMQEGKK